MDKKKLKTLLKLEGILPDDITDDDLEILLESKKSELDGLLPFDIYPKDRKQIIHEFKGKLLELDYYPILQVARIYYKHKPLHPKEYSVNGELGIIYFNKHLTGSVRIDYTSGFDELEYAHTIDPLLKEMVAYTLTYNKWRMGDNISSIKEGDVSVNYDTNNGRGTIITNRINELKNQYTARIRWI